MHCTQCGKAVSPSDKFCSACGAKLPDVSDGASNNEIARSKPRRRNANGCLMAGGILIVILIIASMNDRKDQTEGSKDPIEIRAEASKALEAANAVAGVPPANDSGSAWSYNSHEDAVRGGNTVQAFVTSTNSVNLDFPYQGGSTVTMYVRKSPAWGTDVYFVLSKGQLLCNSYSGCHAMVRFDDGPARRFNLNESSDNSSDTVFVEGAQTFISALKKAKKTIVELEIYQSGRPQFEFDTAGLEWPPKK